MMKGAEDREDTITLSSNDYPNGQIRKSETLNGASSSIKKMLEVTKSSLSFDMTVKKVNIPPQWETLSFGSSNDIRRIQNKGLTNGLSCNGIASEEDFLCEEDLLSEDDDGKTDNEPIILDFIEDSEKFGLSDSEVDKLLADVEDKEEEEEPPQMSKSDERPKEKNGINSESDTSNETNTTGGVADRCGSSSESSSVAAISNCENDRQSNHDELNIEVCKEQDEVSDHLKPVTETSIDCNIKSNTDIVTDGVGEDTAISVKPVIDSEKSLKSQEEMCGQLESSSCINDNFKTLKSSVDPSSDVVNHKQTDHQLEDDGKSSHSVCDEHGNKNDESSDIPAQLLSEKSSDEDCANFSQNNSNDFNKESHDGGALPSNEVMQNNINTPNEISCSSEIEDAELSDVEMQVDHCESSEKLVNMDVESDDIEQNESVRDTEIQSNHSDQISDSEDIVVEDHEIGNSDPMETCNDETDSSEKCDQIEMDDCSEQEEKLPCPDSQPAVDVQSVSSGEQVEIIAAGESNHSEGVPVRNFIRVKNSSELQAVCIDNQEKATELDKQSTVDETCTVSVKKPETICDKNERPITEDAVCNKEVEKLVRKRSSSVDSDVARENKRTRVETSDNETSESTSGSDKGDSTSTLESDESEKLVKSDTQEATVVKNKNSEGERFELSSENCETSREENEKAVESSEKKKSDADKEKCDVEQEKQDQVKSSGESPCSSKRPHEQIGLIEVKKVRFTLEMEKQLKLVEAKLSSVSGSSSDSDGSKEPEKFFSKGSKEPEKSFSEVNKEPGKSFSEGNKEPGKSSSERSKEPEKSFSEVNKEPGKSSSEGNKEPEKSLPPSEPKTNLDLAIERVVAGITHDAREKDSDHMSTRKLNPMPFIKDLHQNLLKKLSKNDLEELVVQKMCEVVTERCTLGEVRQRCQSLEQMLDQWRRKAQQLQKQLKDMEMVMKRYMGDARLRKERPIPVKITRSVGLQVHMGALGPGMLRNRNLGDPSSRTPGQIRRRINRTSSPPSSAGTSTQQQQQQKQQQSTQSPQQQQPAQQQQRQTQPVVRTSSNPITVQKVVTPGFTKLTTSTPSISQTIVPRPPLTTLVASTPTKIAPAPVKPIIARPAIVTATISGTITTGSTTSTVNTVNSTVVNTTNTLRITSASQLNNRQQPKTTTIYTPVKTGSDHKVIDLTDEEDKAKATMGVVRPIIPTSATLTASLVSTNTTTNIVSSSPNIQTGSIRVVQPHQLTGSTTATILAPSGSAPTASRLAYFVPTTGGAVQQRQVLIASSASQVRPGVMTVSSRQNQLPTFLFKSGTVVPIQQASGTGPVNSATIIRSCPPVQTNPLQQVLNTTRPGQQIRVPSSLVGRMTTPTLTSVASALASKHPAPLPNPPIYQPSNVNWKCAPPKPELKISKVANKNQQGIVLSWNMTLTSEFEEIASYQLYAYQEGSAQPSTSLWKKVGDVKALPLPMACTLTQFMEGHKYHFAVRAVDVHTRVGPFSTPGNIVLTRK